MNVLSSSFTGESLNFSLVTARLEVIIIWAVESFIYWASLFVMRFMTTITMANLLVGEEGMFMVGIFRLHHVTYLILMIRVMMEEIVVVSVMEMVQVFQDSYLIVIMFILMVETLRLCLRPR
jgi:hypothetical protein